MSIALHILKGPKHACQSKLDRILCCPWQQEWTSSACRKAMDILLNSCLPKTDSSAQFLALSVVTANSSGQNHCSWWTWFQIQDQHELPIPDMSIVTWNNIVLCDQSEVPHQQSILKAFGEISEEYLESTLYPWTYFGSGITLGVYPTHNYHAISSEVWKKRIFFVSSFWWVLDHPIWKPIKFCLPHIKANHIV
jgi:hypothetical protein